MLNKFLLWIAEFALNWAISRTKSEITDYVDKVKDDEKFEVTNDSNVAVYTKAKTRLEKIKAAEALLSRVKPHV